ncbi:hypothetical protein C0993_001751 [Termitomyces sp. T159_Od127]|nr:hypothetical protein C0993_001751 [Termitomyces sp. T159_Od127]
MDVSCHSSRKTKEAAYDQIQSDIFTLNSSIVALKKYHNSLNNTARLPDELLARIFTWNLSMQRKDGEVPWIRVAAVCTSWRRVALNCPQLWSFIRHRRTSWITEVLLPRSGDVPLHINVTLFRRVTWEGLRKALEEMHRIRELAFTDKYVAPVRIDKLLSGLTDPAPILESFRVDTGSRQNIHRLPDNLFGGFAPKLRKLKLKSCIMPTSSPLLSGITILVLEDLDTCLSFSKLVTLLRGTPNVETLKLKRACKFTLRSGKIVRPSPKVTVELSHLRRLVMRETVIGCGIFLSHICHASRLARLEIEPHECDANEAQVLGHQLAARMSSVSHLTVLSRGKLEIYGQWEEKNKPPTDLEFYIQLPGLSDYRSDATKVILSILPLANIRSLRTTCKLALDFWLERFADMTYLNTICVESYPAELIEELVTGISKSELRAMLTRTDPRERAEAGLASHIGDDGSVSGDQIASTGAELTEQSETSENEQLGQEPCWSILATLPSVPGPLRFVALKNLQIRSWRFGSSGLDTNLLAAMLEARGIRGSTLQKLSIEQSIHYSQNADEDLARIRRIVGSVTWDVENGLLYASTHKKCSAGKIFQTRRRSDAHSSDFHESSVPDVSDRESSSQ